MTNCFGYISKKLFFAARDYCTKLPEILKKRIISKEKLK